MQTLIQKFLTGLGFLGLLLLGFQGVASAADGDTCTAITSVPFTISLPGAYCVTKELSTASTFTSGAAITVNSNDVTIDLGGHTLSNLAAGKGTQAVGIQDEVTSGVARQNITVRNGTVRGFYEGVVLTGATGMFTDSSGHLVENVRADFNRHIGIQLFGAGSVARQNQVLHTGGSTSVAGFAAGLWIAGDGAQALDNTVVDTVRSGGIQDGVGINVDANNGFTGVVIEGNRVSNVALENNSVAIIVGTGANYTLVVNNRIANFESGILFATNASKYRDNLAVNTTILYVGGADEGNNK